MPDEIDEIIESLKEERDDSLRRKMESLKLKEAEVLLAEKDAELEARLRQIRSGKLKSSTAVQLSGRILKGVGVTLWRTAKAIHKENVQTRRMEARAITTSRRTRQQMQEDMR